VCLTTEPTEAPQTTPDPKLKMGMSNGLLVAVIVAAFFVILVIIGELRFVVDAVLYRVSMNQLL